MDIKVSICIPVYGVEKYIEKCARSLFEQTMRDGLEFVFVNDCTPDKSIEILEQVLSEYPHRKAQTKIINLPDNGGVGRARHIAVENCTGEYIIHCDPDDWVELDMYEKMYNVAKGNDADMVYCDYIKELENGTSKVIKNKTFSSGNEVICAMASLDMFASLWCCMYRHEIAKKDFHEYQLDHLTLMEDIMRNVVMLFHCNKVIHVQESFYHYYIRQISLVHSSMTPAKAEGIYKGVDFLSKLMKTADQAAALASRKRLALLNLIKTKSVSSAHWHDTWKEVKVGMWKDKHFSLKAKFVFYLACINYPFASWIYRKIKK